MVINLVVDIGSSSVGAALVSVSKNVAPKIIFNTRLQVVQNNTGGDYSLVAVTQTLDAVMKTVAAEHASVHKTHIVLSSPWYFSRTKILKVEHDLPTLITRHSIEKLTEDAVKKVVAEDSSKGEIVEHRIIRTRLNGYDTLNPYNKKAKNVEATFFASFVTKDVLESVRRVVEKYFHIKNSEVSSFSLAAWSAISGILPDERDYLIVDVRGEVTDLSLVVDGVLIKSQSFPQGKNSLVQAVTQNSSQSPAAALSLINVVLHGNGGPIMQTDIAKFADPFKQAWLQEYAKTLQEMSAESIAIPPTIFLMTDPDIEIFFENIMNEINNDGKLHLMRHLDTRSFLESSSVVTDPFLALESIFVTMIQAKHD